MIHLTHAPNLAIATLWADVLTPEGIDARVQRQYLGSGAGDLPPDQCLPEVWVENHTQVAKARLILHDLQHMPQQRWQCGCGELVEGGFQQCWSCGTPMPS